MKSFFVNMKQIQHEHIFLGHGAFRDLSRKSHRSQTVQKKKSYFRRHQYSWVFQVLNGTWNEWPLISCVRIPKFKCTKMKSNTKETTLQTLCEKKLSPVIKFGFCWDLDLSLARNERHLYRRISHGLYSNLVTRSQFYFIRAHVKCV